MLSTKLIGSILRCRLSPSLSLHYSTQRDPLVSRIMPLGNPQVSIAPVLNQWVEQGKSVNNAQLNELINLLKKHRRFTHALQASEWMSDKNKHNISPVDIAIKLDLIAKVRGIEEAEKYFDSIPDNLRVSQVHAALLHCYTTNKSSRKAEIVMQECRELGFLNTLHYNHMLNLYFQTGEYEKIDPLVQEMVERGINPDNYTYTAQLNAYGASSDVKSMEKLLLKMESHPLITMKWDSYNIAAHWYLKAKLTYKASLMLKKAEDCIDLQTRKLAYESILSLHATAGNKDEVYRIWRLYKNSGKFYNKGYFIMIQALVLLDDIDGAERIFAEWASGCITFEFRILNCMVIAYCKKGLSGKAEALVNKLVKSGKQPEPFTWSILSTGYCFEGQMGKAEEILKKAILAAGSQQNVPNRVTSDLYSCLENPKEKREVEPVEELLGVFKQRFQVNFDDYNELVGNVVDNGNPRSAGGDWDDQD